MMNQCRNLNYENNTVIGYSLFTKKIFLFLLLGMISLFAGCQDKQRKDTSDIGGIKLGDLAPAKSEAPKETVIELGVHVFELSADNVEGLSMLWEGLYRTPVRLANPRTFAANGFAAGAGEGAMIEKAISFFHRLGAREVDSYLMLVTEGMSEDIFIGVLNGQRDVFYTSIDGAMAGSTIGPGAVIVRVKANSMAGYRDRCVVNFAPMFLPAGGSGLPELAKMERAEQLYFKAAAAELVMARGDFFCYGPSRYNTSGIALSNLVFNVGGPIEKVRFYVIMCNNIRSSN